MFCHFLKFALLILSSLCFGSPVKICLNVLLEKDEKLIFECLKSGREVADCISVSVIDCDTDTLEKVKYFFTASGIPGKIHFLENKDPQKLFASSVAAAQATLLTLGFSLENSYILSLDSSKKISIPTTFYKSSLKEDSYSILEKIPYSSHHQFTPCLFKASLFPNSPSSSHKVWSLLIEQQVDEKVSDTQKYQKELLALLEKNPHHSNVLLPLGESYKILKQYDRAFELFHQQIQRAGNLEETWLAKYMIGECYEEKGDWIQALYWYLEAFQLMPHRGDPLFKIAAHYRYDGKNDLAHLFAKYGNLLDSKNSDSLFPSPPLQRYQFDEELSIVSYYTQFRRDGLRALNHLILTKETPGHTKDQAYRNLLYYISPLPEFRFQPIEIELPFVEGSVKERYLPMNPSILKTERGYQLICRAVNYNQTGAKIFDSMDPEGIFRTRNFFVEMDRNFRISSQKEILEDLPRNHYAFLVQGLEDCRLFTYDKSLWFVSSTWDANPHGTVQMVLCQMEENPAESVCRVKQLIPLIGPKPTQCEKNWLPFVKNGEIHFVYHAAPFTIYKPDLSTGTNEIVLSNDYPLDFSRFRGSAAPIAWNGGYLMMVHEVVFSTNYDRSYLHRFLYLNQNFEVEKISTPFVFNHFGVEFCLSMTLDHTEKDLVMSIGIEDKEMFLCFLDLTVLNGLLEPIPNL